MQTREETIRYLMSLKADMVTRRDQLVREIEYLEGTIALLRSATPQNEVQPTQLTMPMEFPVGKLRNLTQKQAVITIAKYLGGTIRTQDAKRLMIRAGIMRDTKNSTNITHNTIVHSERFERVGPGEYRLKEFNQQTKESAAHMPVQ